MKDILVVDDDADIREMLQLVLEGEGYRVLAVSNGTEALSILDDGLRPAVILLDLMMKEMNGYAFCSARATRPAWREIPVLVLTGHGNARDVQASLGVAAVNKPVEMKTLVEAIRRLSGS